MRTSNSQYEHNPMIYFHSQKFSFTIKCRNHFVIVLKNKEYVPFDTLCLAKQYSHVRKTYKKEKHIRTRVGFIYIDRNILEDSY